MNTVLITGASRGLGKALADVFYDNNYKRHLILHSKTLKEEHSFSRDQINGDLRKIETIANLKKAAEENNIDILINNAGVHLKKNIFESRNDEIKEILDINLMAQIRLTKAIWPIFVKKQSGMIININSLAGKYMDTKEAAYCISKHAFHAFTESLRVQAMFNNIRVLEVFLGAMKTDMTKDRAEYDKLIPPEDAAATIYKMVENPDTLNVNEITIKRTYY